MPTVTPSESSEVSTNVWVVSKAPRAYSKYTVAPAIKAIVSNSKAAALRSKCATGLNSAAGA